MANPHTAADGSKLWLDDERRMHRIFGPALIRLDGSYGWYRHGNLHCTSGPALMNSDGTYEFHLDKASWINNNVDNWISALNATDEEKVMLKLTYGGY